MRLKLQHEFPELRYICSILNRMTIEGNVIRVKIEQALDTPYVRIEVQRCRKYSFVVIQRNLESVDAEIKSELSKISPDDVLLFDSNETGSYVDICAYESYSKLPRFNLPGIPDIMIPSLDKADDNSLVLKSIFILRKSFYELDYLAKVFNMLLERHAFARMTIKDKKHFELCFFVDADRRPSFHIGFGLWIPKRNSKQFSSWDPAFYENEVARFNRLLTGCDNHFTGKFYLQEGIRPTLTFRAVSKKHKP